MLPIVFRRVVIAFLATGFTVPAAIGLSQEKPTADPANVARQILDDAQAAKQRQDLIPANLDRAGEIVAAMTNDLSSDSKEEYRRMPWIWRVAVAAGRKNETPVLRKLLDTALPKVGEPLRDWQAVVIGGGIITGVSEQGLWPGERVNELLLDQPELTKRWRQTLAAASAMADNEKVPTSTRYDALRIIPLDGWKLRGAQLAKYLQKGVHDELQMGAISGASDVDAPEVAGLLAEGLAYFPPRNRALAIDALLRTESRTLALVEALEQKRIQAADLKEAQVESLRKLKNEKLRARAEKALTP